MVARGTYSELQGSGVDFTSLLKEDEDEEQDRATPGGLSRSPHTLAQSSMLSHTSALQSIMEGTDHLPLVGPHPQHPLHSLQPHLKPCTYGTGSYTVLLPPYLH